MPLETPTVQAESLGKASWQSTDRDFGVGSSNAKQFENTFGRGGRTLGTTASAAGVSSHGNSFLVLLDVLKERNSALQLPAIDSLSGLAGVLEGDSQEGTAGAGRLGGLDLGGGVSNLLTGRRRNTRLSVVVYCPMHRHLLVVRFSDFNRDREDAMFNSTLTRQNKMVAQLSAPATILVYFLLHRRGGYSPSRRLERGYGFDGVSSRSESWYIQNFSTPLKRWMAIDGSLTNWAIG